MNIITKIIDRDDFTNDSNHPKIQRGVEGFKIEFSSGKSMYIVIDNGSQCCEDYGHICTEDDLSQFIGAEFLGYELVENDETLNKIRKDCQDRFELAGDYESTSVVFVNILTNKGDFQFVLYNHHNGYYGHDVFIIVDDMVQHEETL